MSAASKNAIMQHSLCEGFWKEQFDSVVRVYARTLAQLVHDVLHERSSDFGLSKRDLEHSDKLLQALMGAENTTISTLLKKGGISPKLRRFVICIMRRLANIQIKKGVFAHPQERLPWTGPFYDFSKPDVLDNKKFFPVDELAFFAEIFKK